MARTLTEDEIKRTVHLFGKPYHWTLNDDGALSLQPGPTEYEKIRWEVVQQLIDKGVDPSKITAEMIDKVIDHASNAAALGELITEVENARR